MHLLKNTGDKIMIAPNISMFISYIPVLYDVPTYPLSVLT